MDRQEFGLALLREFLTGERDFPPDSWVHRENWLVSHRVALPSTMLEKKIEKVVARATGEDKEPWAWESLRRLYNHCPKTEPLPPPLQAWVDDVVNGKVEPPTQPGRKPDTGKHSRYLIAFTVLTEFLKYSNKRAIKEIGKATGQPYETVRSFLSRS